MNLGLKHIRGIADSASAASPNCLNLATEIPKRRLLHEQNCFKTFLANLSLPIFLGQCCMVIRFASNCPEFWARLGGKQETRSTVRELPKLRSGCGIE